jgi:hypothetical protein
MYNFDIIGTLTLGISNCMAENVASIIALLRFATKRSHFESRPMIVGTSPN